MEPEKYEIIEKYKNNELSADEKEEFEARMAKDKDFANTVNTYLEIETSLQSAENRKAKEKDLKDTLTSISNEYFEHERSAKMISMRNVYWVAAACLILLASLTYLLYQPTTPTYGDYANYQPLALVDRSSDGNLSMKAEEAFNNGNYEKAAMHLETLLESEADNNYNLQLYWALSLIEINKYKKSDSLLLNIAQTESIYASTAQWYLALSYLKQGKKEACKKQLKTITTDSDKYSKAQELLKEL